MPLGGGDVQRLLREHDLRPSKALGQHFVTDPNTVRRVVRVAGIAPGDRVLEIGAGVGSLTVALAEAGARVTAVEIDRRLAAVLDEVVARWPVRVVVADALDVDWGPLLSSAPSATGVTAVGNDVDDDRPWRLVANLPYNVATPLVLGVLEDAPSVASMTVMVQREVGERMAATVGQRAYGAVSVRVAYWADAVVVGHVPPTVFVPRPKVESALVRIDRRPAPSLDPATVTYERFTEVVRAGFGHRRKMLRRSLSGVVDVGAFSAAGVDPRARAEALSVADWGRLAAWDPRPST